MVTRGRRVVAVVAAAGLALLIAVVAVIAVQRLRGNPTYPVDTPLADQCNGAPADATRLVLDADDGFRLGAALVGPPDATTGLVLRQGAGQTICEWLPLAVRIAEETGARVLLFDRRGRGSSPGEGNLPAEVGDTLTAIGWLRDHGAERVGLMASSMGNSVMFAALPGIDPAPCVVASVSPVLVSGDGNGTVDGTGLSALPDNVWVVAETQNDAVASYAERVVAAAGTDHYLAIDTDAHSFGLVRDNPEAADFLVAAVASCEAP